MKRLVLILLLLTVCQTLFAQQSMYRMATSATEPVSKVSIAAKDIILPADTTAVPLLKTVTATSEAYITLSREKSMPVIAEPGKGLETRKPRYSAVDPKK
jgi:hypothetical protein